MPKITKGELKGMGTRNGLVDLPPVEDVKTETRKVKKKATVTDLEDTAARIAEAVTDGVVPTVEAVSAVVAPAPMASPTPSDVAVKLRDPLSLPSPSVQLNPQTANMVPTNPTTPYSINLANKTITINGDCEVNRLVLSPLNIILGDLETYIVNALSLRENDPHYHYKIANNKVVLASLGLLVIYEFIDGRFEAVRRYQCDDDIIPAIEVFQDKYLVVRQSKGLVIEINLHTYDLNMINMPDTIKTTEGLGTCLLNVNNCLLIGDPGKDQDCGLVVAMMRQPETGVWYNLCVIYPAIPYQYSQFGHKLEYNRDADLLIVHGNTQRGTRTKSYYELHPTTRHWTLTNHEELQHF